MLFHTASTHWHWSEGGNCREKLPSSGFFSSFGDCWTEMGQQEQMQVFSTPVPDGSTGILLCAPLQGFPTSISGCPKGKTPTSTVCSALVPAGTWWELPAAKVTLLELYKLKETGNRKERTMGRNRDGWESQKTQVGTNVMGLGFFNYYNLVLKDQLC